MWVCRFGQEDVDTEMERDQGESQAVRSPKLEV